MSVRDTGEHPLHDFDTGKDPDVQKRRAAFKDTLKFEKRPSASAADVGEEGDPVAPDRKEDRVSDSLCNRAAHFCSLNLSHRFDDFRKGTGVCLR